MKNERFFREKRWYMLLLGAIPVGIIVGLSALAFVTFMRIGTLVLWTMLAGVLGIAHATEQPWFILGVTSVGGLLVGLCTALFRAGGEVHLLQELQQEGSIAFRKVPGTLLTALVSLVFGASVGPEGPLLELGAGIGSLLAERFRLSVEQARILTYMAASAVFDSPFGSAFLALELPHAQDRRFYRLLFPGIVASIMAYGLFFCWREERWEVNLLFLPIPASVFSISSMLFLSASSAQMRGFCSFICSENCTISCFPWNTIRC